MYHVSKIILGKLFNLCQICVTKRYVISLLAILAKVIRNWKFKSIEGVIHVQYFVFEKSDIKYPEGERIHPLLRIRFLNRRVLSHQIKIYPTSYLSVKTLLHSRNIYSHL